jgi:hypothetical protein
METLTKTKTSTKHAIAYTAVSLAAIGIVGWTFINGLTGNFSIIAISNNANGGVYTGYKCNDPDQGQAVFVRSVTTGLSADRTTILQGTDECTPEGNHTEYLCGQSQYAKSKNLPPDLLAEYTFACPFQTKCANGACVFEKCIDSDGGLNPKVVGQTLAKDPTGNYSYVMINTDRCIPINGKMYVEEFACSSSDPKKAFIQRMLCTGGCEAGRCL